MIKIPNCKPKRVSEIVELIDLPATFTDLCEVSIGKHQYDGASLKGIINGNSTNWKSIALSEYDQRNDKNEPLNKDLSFGRMLIEGDFKCCISGNMVH